MKTLARREAEALWDKYWDEMRQEWFKLEVLQDYSAEDDSPSLRSWLRGHKHRSIKLMKAADNREWAESCQRKLSQGVELIRIHVVEQPRTAYISWEIEHYRNVNIAQCGESVYLLDKSKAKDLELPAGDLMIFDKRRAVLNKYGANGLMIEETFYDENDDVANYVKLKNELMKRAEKL